MTLPLALGMPSWPDLLFILMIVLVLFGAKRLPELARGVAQSLNEFRKVREEFETELHKTSTAATSQPSASQPAKLVAPEGRQTHAPSQPQETASQKDSHQDTQKQA